MTNKDKVLTIGEIEEIIESCYEEQVIYKGSNERFLNFKEDLAIKFQDILIKINE